MWSVLGANSELITPSFTGLLGLPLAAHEHHKAEVHGSGNKVVCLSWLASICPVSKSNSPYQFQIG